MDGDLEAFWLACHMAVSARHSEQLLCRAVCCCWKSVGARALRNWLLLKEARPVVLRPVSTEH